MIPGFIPVVIIRVLPSSQQTLHANGDDACRETSRKQLGDTPAYLSRSADAVQWVQITDAQLQAAMQISSTATEAQHTTPACSCSTRRRSIDFPHLWRGTGFRVNMCEGGRPEAASMASHRRPQPAGLSSGLPVPEQEAAGGGGGGAAEATRRPRGWRAVAFIIGLSARIYILQLLPHLT